MGDRNTDHVVKSAHRQTFTVPANSGDYAGERITFGAVQSGEASMSYARVTAWFEGLPSSMPSGVTAELWVPPALSSGQSAVTDADYSYAGKVVLPVGIAGSATGADAQYGLGTWDFGGLPGGQIRVKSGGVGGSVTVSMVAF